tara:strand:- start:500 stop:619 length:120 start_codon:yes stop_codon:yes gene_type:complete
MVRVIAIGKSLYDAMIFGTWTIGSVLIFLTLIGFLQWNI